MAEIESVVSRGKKEHALFTDIEIDVVSIDEKTRYDFDLDLFFFYVTMRNLQYEISADPIDRV